MRCAASERGDKVRVPKASMAGDVADVSWKTLKSGSVVFTVHRAVDAG